MGIQDIFNDKDKEKKQRKINRIVSKQVHDDKNKFQAHMLRVKSESTKLNKEIDKARKTGRKLQKLLVTEIVLGASGGTWRK